MELPRVPGGGTPLYALYGGVPLDGVGFGLFVLNRVYNFYVSVLNKVCILSFILNKSPKMKGVVLYRVIIIGYFRDFFCPLGAALYPNMGQVPPPPFESRSN